MDPPVIALVSGANRVDPAKLASAVGAGDVRRADGDEARSATGVAIGGVPPFGHIRPVAVVVDRDLLAHDRVWAAAGLPDAVFADPAGRPRERQRRSRGRPGRASSRLKPASAIIPPVMPFAVLVVAGLVLAGRRV